MQCSVPVESSTRRPAPGRLVGVEGTARAAYDLGFHVVLATDAITDVDAAAHANSVERVFPKLGETGSAERILDLLGRGR